MRSGRADQRAGVRAVDSRLTPDEADRVELRFPPAAKEVRVRLVHRKFWQGVARAKGWPEEEITISDRIVRDE